MGRVVEAHERLDGNELEGADVYLRLIHHVDTSVRHALKQLRLGDLDVDAAAARACPRNASLEHLFKQTFIDWFQQRPSHPQPPGARQALGRAQDPAVRVADDDEVGVASDLPHMPDDLYAVFAGHHQVQNHGLEIAGQQVTDIVVTACCGGFVSDCLKASASPGYAALGFVTAAPSVGDT